MKALGIDVDLQSEGSGEDLANAVVAFDRERSVQTREVLLPQSAIARVQLRQILSEASYPVRHYPVYTTVTIAPRYSLELARMCSSTYVAATVITAPSSARALKDVAPYLFPHIPVIVLGQASATTMAEIAPEAQVIVADHPTPDAVADCIKRILETHAGHSPQKGI
ncbi:uroporphyrinogen-III synthase [Schaalia turicensis]